MGVARLALAAAPLALVAACGSENPGAEAAGTGRSASSADDPAASAAPIGPITDARIAQADSIVADWVSAGRIPGAVLSISQTGVERFTRAYGYAQSWLLEGGDLVPMTAPRAMDTGTVFDLASVSKVMGTTYAAMLLVHRGELDLDQTVATAMPEFTGGGRETITPRHLLTHTSGLPQWWPTYYDASTAEEALAFLIDTPLMWEVGAERHYSDLGFMTLGLLVERISGQTLDAFLDAELYGPLGLTTTGYRPTDGRPARLDDLEESAFAATSHGNPFERRMVHDSEFGYTIDTAPDRWSDWRQRTLVGEVNDGNAYHAFEGVAGHAGLFSTAAELQTLLAVLLGGGRPHSPALDTEAVTQFLTEQVPGQALGWQLPDYAPEGSFTHTGFTGTWVLGVPGQSPGAGGLGVVLLTNRQHGGVDASTQYPDVGPLQRAVAEVLLGP